MEYNVIVITEVKITVPRRLGLIGQKRLGEMVQGRVERLLLADSMDPPFSNDQLDFGPTSVTSKS
jgi:hypothetical protein